MLTILYKIGMYKSNVTIVEGKAAGERRDGVGGKWFSVLAAGNGFSKYSGQAVSAGRNRQQFAVRAHSWLLVTSVSPNCCLYTEY